MPKLYPTPSDGGLSPITDAIAESRRRQREIERPSGTNLNSLVGQVQAALANINATVAAAISANSYTKVAIDDLIAHPPAPVSITGTLTASGVATFDAGVSSLDARNTTVITGRAALWADVGGRFGNSSSSVDVKQDFSPADPRPRVDAILSMGLLEYRRIEAVEEYGDAAPVEYGSIVEYVAKTPLADATFSDADGAPQGINWADMVPSLIATVQSLHADLQAANRRLDAAGL